jgi:hypothetical protein
MKIYQPYVVLSATIVLLTSCLSTQTYFSEVFNLAYDAYQPIKNQDNFLAMNYQADLEVVQDGETYYFEAYFFETGFKVVKNGPAVVNDITTREYLSTLFDYEAEGVFEDQSFATNSNEIKRRFVALTPEEMEGYGSAVTMVEGMLTPEIRNTLTSRVTDLIIGGQPSTFDLVTYSLPLADFIPLSDLESLVGFLPTSINNEISYVKSTEELTLELTVTDETEMFEVTLILSNPGMLNASDFLLTDAQKADYEGYLV